MKKICVCGGRDFADAALVYRVLNSALSTFGEVTVVTGNARGADSLANAWARHNNCELILFPADWTTHGRAAGPIRNREMLKAGFDVLVAFPGGNGTADMVSITKKAGIPVYEIEE